MTTGAFDIFNPPVSKLVAGIEGKVITLMGGNSTGKTLQATKFPKPFYLGFEAGINAIGGVPHKLIEDWADFMAVNRQLTSPMNRDKVKEMYQTIIFDEVYTASLYCQDYVTRKHGVNTIGEGNGGFGLWKEYETAFFKEIDKLLKLGLTIVFIIHVEQNKEGQYVPKGDKRSVDPVIDNSDVAAFLKPNGVDEKGKLIPSSAIYVETEQAFARTRFYRMKRANKVFSAENLIQDLAEAIEKAGEMDGAIIQTFAEKAKEDRENEVKLSYEEVLAEINRVGKILNENKQGATVAEVVREVLGFHKTDDGKIGEQIKPSEVGEDKVDILYVLLLDLKDIAYDKGIDIEVK